MNKLVYVAHPYSGKKENKDRVDELMKDFLINDAEHTYVSPIHNFGMSYFEKDYARGLEICLHLLENCDALVLCGDWQNSKGCIGEWAFAKAKGIKIYELDTWRKINQNFKRVKVSQEF